MAAILSRPQCVNNVFPCHDIIICQWQYIAYSLKYTHGFVLFSCCCLYIIVLIRFLWFIYPNPPWQLHWCRDITSLLRHLNSLAPQLLVQKFIQSTIKKPFKSCITGSLCWIWPHTASNVENGRIRLSVSTASHTYELSEETHVTPFHTYRFHSTGHCNYKP